MSGAAEDRYARGMQSETVLFAEGGVLVTSARLVVGGVTYPLGGITSARLVAEKKSPALVAIGVALMLCGLWGAAAGFRGGSDGWGVVGGCVGLVGAGTLFSFWVPSEVAVVVVTASGEARAISTRDDAFAARVLAVINQAVAARG